MNYYEKYVKYKTKYVGLKNLLFSGGSSHIYPEQKNSKLKFYHIGNKQHDFQFNKFLDISEATSAIFINNDMLVVTKSGEIFYIEKYLDNPSIIKIKDMKEELDFSFEGNEEGLLGIASNKSGNKIYLSYTHPSNKYKNGIDLSVDEYDFIKKELKKNQNIMNVSFRTNYHHGGHIIYGPDDKLYFGLGDGGPQNDPYDEAQNPNTLRGKLFGIDPKTKKISMIAIGLRNPWIFSMDNQKRIWIGDVGWNSSESIKLIPDIDRYYNFGWSFYEGSLKNKSGKKFDDFDHPIWEYPTDDQTGRSVIGGYFIDHLNIYVFADFLGFVRAIKFDDNKWKQIGINKINTGELIYSLAYDNKNIYVLTDKQIYQMVII